MVRKKNENNLCGRRKFYIIEKLSHSFKSEKAITCFNYKHAIQDLIVIMSLWQ